MNVSVVLSVIPSSIAVLNQRKNLTLDVHVLKTRQKERFTFQGSIHIQLSKSVLY